jgi:hypothetical protein
VNNLEISHFVKIFSLLGPTRNSGHIVFNGNLYLVYGLVWWHLGDAEAKTALHERNVIPKHVDKELDGLANIACSVDGVTACRKDYSELNALLHHPKQHKLVCNL